VDDTTAHWLIRIVFWSICFSLLSGWWWQWYCRLDGLPEGTWGNSSRRHPHRRDQAADVCTVDTLITEQKSELKATRLNSIEGTW